MLLFNINIYTYIDRVTRAMLSGVIACIIVYWLRARIRRRSEVVQQGVSRRCYDGRKWFDGGMSEVRGDTTDLEGGMMEVVESGGTTETVARRRCYDTVV